MSSKTKYREDIEDLLINYFEYFDQCSFPNPGDEHWDDVAKDWVAAFGEHRYSPQRVADAMSRIKRDPPRWKQDHLPALLKLIAEDGRSTPPGEAPAFEACDKCGGNGWATIYRSDYRGDESIVVHDPIHDKTRRVYLRITAPCVCNLGRRAYASCVAKRTGCVDLAAMPRGWGFDDPSLEA